VHEFSHRIFVMGVVRTHDREAARELVQDVLIAVIGALRKGQLQDAEKLAAFVHGTARNLINNRLRTASHTPPLESLPDDLAQENLVEQLEDAERGRLVHQALERLARAARPEDSADDFGRGLQARGDRRCTWPQLGSGTHAQAACLEEGHGSYREEAVTNLGKFAT
jgi:hypothetical protein